MPFRKLFFQTFCAIIFILLIVAAFVWRVDPYQHYRADDVYIGNQRLEIPGIARHHDYDAVVLGSSMCMNHYPQQIDSLFGWHTRNFTIMGANSLDYAIALPLIFAQHKARHVIWGIDVFSFTKEEQLTEPYLYDENRWNDIAYLLNYTSLKNGISKLLHPLPMDNLYHFNSPVNKEALMKAYVKGQKEYFSGEKYDYDTMCKLFDNSVNYPPQYLGVNEICIYFPPYSIGEFLLLDDYGFFDTYISFKKYVISQFLKLKNVRIYDFQVADWVTNLDEYMDLRHHSHQYNRRIIECIKNDEYRLPANYSDQIDEFVRMVKEYDRTLLTGDVKTM